MTFTQFNDIVDAIDNIYEIIDSLDNDDILKKDYELLVAKMYQVIDRTYSIINYPD